MVLTAPFFLDTESLFEESSKASRVKHSCIETTVAFFHENYSEKFVEVFAMAFWVKGLHSK